MKIHFVKASREYEKVIFDWLEEPHMRQFWDNSQEHKDDIRNFIDGRKEPSSYFKGIATYWIGLIDKEPFAFLLTTEMRAEQDDLTPLHRANLSKTGHTITIDFGIGNPAFFGKGLGAETLNAFVEFYHKMDPKADTFFIDPDENNPRAKRVYEKAGFQVVGEFAFSQGAFNGSTSYLMVRKIAKNL